MFLRGLDYLLHRLPLLHRQHRLPHRPQHLKHLQLQVIQVDHLLTQEPVRLLVRRLTTTLHQFHLTRFQHLKVLKP